MRKPADFIGVTDPSHDRRRNVAIPGLSRIGRLQSLGAPMKSILSRRIAVGLASASMIGAAYSAPSLDLLNAFTFTDGAKQGGIEIVSYTPDNFTVAGIYVSDLDGGGAAPTTFGVQILNLGTTGNLTERFQIDLNAANTGLSALGGVSSVALDPSRRGFGVAAVIPNDNTTTLGKLAFFNYNTGAVLGTINAGFHPDSVRFSADGTKIYVANEGEFKSGAAQAPGSLSIVDVSAINTGNLSSLAGLSASTFDFSAGNLGSGATLSGMRNSNVAAVGTSGTFINAVPDFTNPANIDVGAIEPEYVTVSGNKAFVTLQDNNAIGVFDFTTNKWEKINQLGTITQKIDASDSDGSTGSNTEVKGMPMPDTIASYQVGGTTFLVTANEGDARVDDRDISRLGDVAGTDSMSLLLDDAAFPNDQSGVRANAALGRLNVSRIDGDTDKDGDIDEAVMIGTRSYSIWQVNADNSLSLAYDSGSLEPLLRALDPAAHNINRGELSAADSRSDDKGPEPEGLSVFTLEGLTVLALMLERENGILLYDISDPNNPKFLDYANTYASGVAGSNTSDRLVSPEGSVYISAPDSPTGSPLLLVGYEGHDGGPNGTIIEGGVGVFAVPEPASGAMLLLAGAGLLGMRPRRRS